VRQKADSAGGKVHVLVGYHEVFGAELELTWVSEAAYAAFKEIPGLNMDCPMVG
jgi:hypothetical protein